MGKINMPNELNIQPLDIKLDNKIKTELDSRYIPANFTEEQEEEIKRIIEDELSLIRQEYAEIGFYEQLQSCKENYEATRESNVSSEIDYDIRIKLQKLIVEILVSRAIGQTFGADPLVLMEQEGEITAENLAKRENRLDFELRKKIKYEEICNSIYEHAIYEPVCITKAIEVHEKDNSTKVENYKPEMREEYEKKFEQQIYNPQSEEFKQWRRLYEGESINIPVNETKETYSGAKVYRVDNNNFYARPKIKDFKKHRVIAEQIDYTWSDIDMRTNISKYMWDVDKVAKIKEAYGEDYKKQIIPFFECIVQYAKNGEGNTRRYVVVMESRTREIVKSCLYTSEEISYTAHSVNPKDDSWIGESMLLMINDLIDTFNANLNYMLYANDMARTQLILTNDPKAIARRELKIGMINVIPFSENSTALPVKLTDPGLDRISVIRLLQDLIYLLSGIDPQLLSGAETPEDPRAPAAKTAMKLQVTNMRVEDKIVKLHYSDVLVCEKIEKILTSIDKENYNYWDKGKEIQIDKSVYNVPVRYIMHGSRMTFSRHMDLNLTLQFIEILVKFYPGIWQDMEVKREILNTIIQDMGGSIKKNKDKIMARIDAYLEMKPKIDKLLNLLQNKDKSQGGPLAKHSPLSNQVATTEGASPDIANPMSQGGVEQGGDVTQQPID